MDLYSEALQRFDELFHRAATVGLAEPTAMTVATADGHGLPSARTILLKAYDVRGFVFFTNQLSRKGRQLAENPRAALCFFWQPLMEQVQIEGSVTEVTPEEADAYWLTRPRESQIGAWASAQSRPLDGRATLESRFAQYAQRFAETAVPRPPHWSGYRVEPRRIEFWKSGAHRLHERVCYEQVGEGWTVTLLNP